MRVMDEYTLLGRVVLRDRVAEKGAVCVRDGEIVYAGSAADAPFLPPAQSIISFTALQPYALLFTGIWVQRAL